MGAMVLAHRERFERPKTQKELSQSRFRPGGRPTPLPNPGVYAHDNGVDMPALLPDGTPAPRSVAGTLQPRKTPPRAPRRDTTRHLRIVSGPFDGRDGRVEVSMNGHRKGGTR
jgi:NADH-quinone oxidoreductase subunit J